MQVMSKQQSRTEMEMVSEILQTTMEYNTDGITISRITRVSGLSHYTAVEKCQKLIRFGLMESRKCKQGQIFTITEKGVQFFSELQKFEEYIQASKINS